jgi:hypothetical protein
VPHIGALAGQPCSRESGAMLSDSHLARKTLASVEIVKAKKNAAQANPPNKE